MSALQETNLASPLSATGDAHRTDSRRALVLAVLSTAVYVFVAGQGRFDFTPTSQTHHVLMADAMLHGQLAIRDAAIQHRQAKYRRYFENIVDAQHAAGDFTVTQDDRDHWVALRAEHETRHDWVIHDGHWYGYWGPLTPAAFIPLVAIFGLDLSDRLVLAVIGGVNVWLFAMMLSAMARGGALSASPFCRALVTILFAFGTSHFWLATSGAVWSTTQVLALAPLLLGMWAVARGDAGPAAWLAAGCGYGLAALGRSTMWLAGGYFAVLMLTRLRVDRPGLILRRAAAFAVPAALAFATQLAYNAARFGDPLESGLRLQVESAGAPRYQQALREHGLFSLAYLPHNAWHYFMHIDGLVHRDGGWGYDPEGNSVFLMTPPMLYTFLIPRLRSRLGFAAAIGAGPIVGMLLLFQGTGWMQFGPRYLLDVTPFLLLLVTLGMNGRISPTAYTLIATALAVQAFGVAQLHLAPTPSLQTMLTPPILGIAVVLAILFRPALARRASESRA